MVIDETAADWACQSSEYLTARLAYLASQWIAENPFDAKRKRVLRTIAEKGSAGLTRSELYAKTRAEVLDGLLSCGDAIEIKEQTGGAPRVRYVAAEHTSDSSS